MGITGLKSRELLALIWKDWAREPKTTFTIIFLFFLAELFAEFFIERFIGLVIYSVFHTIIICATHHYFIKDSYFVPRLSSPTNLPIFSYFIHSIILIIKISLPALGLFALWYITEHVLLSLEQTTTIIGIFFSVIAVISIVIYIILMPWIWKSSMRLPHIAVGNQSTPMNLDFKVHGMGIWFFMKLNVILGLLSIPVIVFSELDATMEAASVSSRLIMIYIPISIFLAIFSLFLLSCLNVIYRRVHLEPIASG